MSSGPTLTPNISVCYNQHSLLIGSFSFGVSGYLIMGWDCKIWLEEKHSIGRTTSVFRLASSAFFLAESKHDL